MILNNLNTQCETELNAKGVEYALNEDLNKMGLYATCSKITPSKVTYNITTMEGNSIIGEISLVNSEYYP